MSDVPAVLAAQAHAAARKVVEEFATSDRITIPLSDAIADAVLELAHAHYGRQLHLRNGRCRWCAAILEPARWGQKHPQPHRMHCRFYSGPLTHTWANRIPNETFGGIDHYCTCGGHVRTGGMSGQELPAVCPRAHETSRTPAEELPTL